MSRKIFKIELLIVQCEYMGKIGMIVLVLIILLGLLFAVGNRFEVSHTSMVIYKEMEPHIYTVTYYEKEPYIAEECEPIYGPDKPGEIICPEPEEGYMTVCYSILGYGDVIGENCTNVTKYRLTLKPRNVTLVKEVKKEKPETFYKSLFEEWDLNFLLLGTTTTIPSVTTIPLKSIYIAAPCNVTNIELWIKNMGNTRIEKDDIKVYIDDGYKGTFGRSIEPLRYETSTFSGHIGLNYIKAVSPTNEATATAYCQGY